MTFNAEYIRCVCGNKIGFCKYIEERGEFFLKYPISLSFNIVKHNDKVLCVRCPRLIGIYDRNESFELDSNILISIEHIKEPRFDRVYVDMENEIYGSYDSSTSDD